MADAQVITQQLIDRMSASGQEAGLQVAAYLHGQLVVSACAGLADPVAGRPVEEWTLFNSWSTGKGSASTVVHVLAEGGLLDYDTPVADYWPQFRAHGKETVTLAHVLTHSAGVPQAPAGTTLADLADWEGTCARIADLEPLWEPGTATGYHALTFGYIIGEVVRRVTGSLISQVLREEVTGPLGIADEVFFGVPVTELGRVARLEDGNWSSVLASRPDDSLFFKAAPHSIQASAELGNRPDYLVIEFPCAGTMTAHGLARMYAALIGEVDGLRLISPDRTTQISTVITTETDRVLGAPIPKGLGYFLRFPEMGGYAGTFGCKGSGGSIAFADPAHGLAFALTHNRLTAPPADVATQVADQVRNTLGISF